MCGRACWGNDLSPYAHVLMAAKLFPPRSLAEALTRMKAAGDRAALIRRSIDLRTIPRWVRRFFHRETLRHTLSWVIALRALQDDFVLAALLGILHHQRPGFLSFPSSHTTPYLRQRAFPSEVFPELYLYRDLPSRLEAKLRRAFRRVPDLDFSIERSVSTLAADQLYRDAAVDAVITSPPYMRLLDYGRDNRLRLWFLGESDWKSLDHQVSPSEASFLLLMRRCFARWHSMLRPGGRCILIVGNSESRTYRTSLPNALAQIATTELKLYERQACFADEIPTERRSRRSDKGSTSETILVLRRKE